MEIMNMSFVHDGSHWIARGESLEVAAQSLGELDQKLREAIKKRYSPYQGSQVTVNLDFDYSTIPTWMIQYHPYYIHRRLEFEY